MRSIPPTVVTAILIVAMFATAAPSAHATTSASPTTAAFAQGGAGPCAASDTSDPAEGGPLDITSYASAWLCQTNILRFTFTTAAGWAADELSTAYVRIDTDGDITNGCSEADYLLYAVNQPGDSDPTAVAGLFRSTTCENIEPIGAVGIAQVAPTTLIMDVNRGLIGDPALIRHYGSLAAMGEDNRTADYAPDTGGVVLDMRPIPDPGSVGVCLPDPAGDVVVRGTDGSTTPVDAPRLDLTEVCAYWGQDIQVDVTIPQLDTARIDPQTRVSVLVSTAGDSTAEAIVRATWTGQAFEAAVVTPDGQTTCTGRVLVEGTVLRIGGLDGGCFGDVDEVGFSPGIGLGSPDGRTTFDRAGPSSLSPLRRAAPADPANIGTDPNTIEAAGPGSRPPTPGLTRLAGAARLETSLAISTRAWTETAAAAVLARQDVEADALAGAPLAAAARGPLLLTTSSSLPNRVATELRRILPQGGRVYVLGGPAALDPQIVADVQQLGFGVVRLSGATRLETGLAIAQETASTLGSVSNILIADAFDFPWALMAGAAAGANDGVIITTAASGLTAEAQAFIQQHPDAMVTAIGPAASSASPGSSALNADGDPYATSALVAGAFFTSPDQAVVASGESFPDGLSGGAFAASSSAPLLLSRRNAVPTSVRNYLSSGSWSAIAMLGGEAALTAAVADTLGTYVP